MQRLMSPMRAVKPQGNAPGETIFVAPPTLGWMPAADVGAAPDGAALVLDNAFPTSDGARIRRGSATYATGMVSDVRTLFAFASGAVRKMFAAAGASIFDVTDGGAVGAAVVTGLTNSSWQAEQFATSGGEFLIAVNGADARRVFDGATWATTPAITGVDSADFSHVWAHDNRLWFVERDTMRAWYLPVNTIGGAAVPFELGGLFVNGGSLLCGGTWSYDAGDGPEDRCVFVSTEGDIAVYGGSDPSDAATWALKGLYQIPRPLGVRCMMKAGGDLAILTEDGLIAMSQAQSLARAALANESVSKNLLPAWRAAVKARTGLAGWQIAPWAAEGMAIVAIPHANAAPFQQFVANLQTGAWSRFVGWDALCFAVHDNRLFFGSSAGVVREAEVGGSDDGEIYTLAYVGPFKSAKNSAFMTATMMRARLRAVELLAPKLSVLRNYELTVPIAPSVAVGTIGGALWDSAEWDAALWGGGVKDQAAWKSVAGSGYALAPCIQITSSQTPDATATLSGLDFSFERARA